MNHLVQAIKQVASLVLGLGIGILLCLGLYSLSGCTLQLDVYNPKTSLVERQLVHDKIPLSFQDRLDLREAYRAAK